MLRPAEGFGGTAASIVKRDARTPMLAPVTAENQCPEENKG
jgi:hypothetical protein